MFWGIIIKYVVWYDHSVSCSKVSVLKSNFLSLNRQNLVNDKFNLWLKLYNKISFANMNALTNMN